MRVGVAVAPWERVTLGVARPEPLDVSVDDPVVLGDEDAEGVPERLTEPDAACDCDGVRAAEAEPLDDRVPDREELLEGVAAPEALGDGVLVRLPDSEGGCDRVGDAAADAVPVIDADRVAELEGVGACDGDALGEPDESCVPDGLCVAEPLCDGLLLSA